MVEGFVVNRSWRVWCCFRYGHLKKEAKKRERKEENEGLEEDDGVAQKTQKNRDSKHKTEET